MKTGQPEFEVRRPPELPGLILVSASYSDHVSAPHAHEEAVIGICYGALEEFQCGTFHGPVAPGSLLAIEPGQIHSDRSRAGRVAMVYIPASLWDPMLRFELPTVTDTTIQQAVETLFASAPTPKSWKVFAALLSSRPWVSRGERQPSEFEALLPRLVADDPPLTQLAAEAGVSPSTFLRRFRAQIGCTPHEYARQARIARAAHRLREGESTVDAALDQDFFDQSHFHRHFRRLYAVPPGVFRMRNSVQS
jgi:AraC-like DNA-binding protein